MLREAKSARFERRLTPLGRRYGLVHGREQATATWGARAFRALQEEQLTLPVPLLRDEARTWWAFEDRVYWEDDDLSADDVLALVRDRERRQRRRLERAHAALAGEEHAERPRREPLPREVRRAVWERDGGACAECGATFDLQYDHVIPIALGGANTVENLQVLCAPCNQRKGAAIG
ncbi:Tellurium resistance protein terE [Patulibacter medicamentivorans]|uniref:Tellurium resistance protein terE n=1 Tax=Patulibacter medicamentivorans TaxID=1097667 RepID=H0E105_9ACTN|nr:HNH endonuclease signature motif containing protein [Patulibacter medicamentivorans]EHN12644.1 Tellurium resistance protein terE [Patulibacter medicamentivorans]